MHLTVYMHVHADVSSIRINVHVCDAISTLGDLHVYMHA